MSTETTRPPAPAPRPTDRPEPPPPSGRRPTRLPWFLGWPLLYLFLLVLPIAVRYLAPSLLSLSGVREEDWPRQSARAAGYFAALFLLVPYLYFLRRIRLNRRGLFNLTVWVRIHLATAFLAFGFALVHADFRFLGAESPLTAAVMVLFALVMASGFLGLGGQKLVYRLTPQLLEEELGPGGLEERRQHLLSRAERLAGNYSLLTVGCVIDWPGFCKRLEDHKQLAGTYWKWLPDRARRGATALRAGKGGPGEKAALITAVNALLFDEDAERERTARANLDQACKEVLHKSEKPSETVRRFYEDVIAPELAAGFSFWPWLAGLRRPPRMALNSYRWVKAKASPAQQGTVDQLWEWLGRRRQLDLEYRLHRLARLWLCLHVPAAWVLLVLALAHVFFSLRYGGF